LKICDDLAGTNSTFGGLLQRCGRTTDEIAAFRDALRLSMQPSVDAFIERRPHFADIGRLSIAASLMPYEQEARLIRLTEMKWYEYLFQRLDTTLATWDKNALSVITFNYDRSLEHFLFLSLKHSFGLDDAACGARLRAMPILHVYGSLGELPVNDPNGRPYGALQTRDQAAEAVIEAGKRIVLLSGRSVDGLMDQAYQLLSVAHRVCFLGFAYHRANLDRLRLKHVDKDAQFYGSAYGLTRKERESVARIVGHDVSLGDGATDCLTFLRECGVLIDDD